MAKNDGYASKGSKRMMQILVSEHPHILNEKLNANLNWLSPLEADSYKEFQLSPNFFDIYSPFNWNSL